MDKGRRSTSAKSSQDSKSRDRNNSNNRRHSSRKKSRSPTSVPRRSPSRQRNADKNGHSRSPCKSYRDARPPFNRCDKKDPPFTRTRYDDSRSRSGNRERKLRIVNGDCTKVKNSTTSHQSSLVSKNQDVRNGSQRDKSRSPPSRSSRRRSKDRNPHSKFSKGHRSNGHLNRHKKEDELESRKRHESSDSSRQSKAGGSLQYSNSRSRHASRDIRSSRDYNNKPTSTSTSIVKVEREEESRKLTSADHNYASKQIKTETKISAIQSQDATSNSQSEASSSDDELEDLQVEKWVRSAPAELYYRRENNGEFKATDRAKRLCGKFEKKLLAKAQVARLEAERLGEDKLVELTNTENCEALEQQRRRLIRKSKPKESCNKKSNCSGGKSKCTGTQKEEKSSVVETCKHEEGEICDCSVLKSDEPNCTSKSKKSTVVNNVDRENRRNRSVNKCNGNETEARHNKAKCKSNPNNKRKGNGKKPPINPCKRSASSSTSGSDSSGSESSDDECGMTRSDAANRELEKKKKHPRRMHEELWHNDPGLMNDGPVCRCSARSRRFGIRHGFYPGESTIPLCDPFSSNCNSLVHYRITISPPKNFLVKTPSVILHDGHEYIFEGFSLFSHYKVDLNLPPCKVIRFNIRYDVFIAEEKFPESFCVKELDIFETYVFREILELLDLKYDWNKENSCAPFHLMPRFVRQLPDNGKEILSMNRVLLHLLKSDREVMKEEDLPKHYSVEQSEWQNFADKHKGMIVTRFGQKPSAIRVDQIDRDVSGQETDPDDGIPFPLIVHFGIRPPQLSYAGNASYQRAWRRYVKYRHLLSNMAKPTIDEKRKLVKKEMKLQEMRTASSMKRDVTVAISCKGFRTTGIFCDLVQHAMLIPVLVAHLRFHKALSTLETTMAYEFKNRYLLQLAMTHPSYRENFGTNPDHARNALTNCGIRQPEYGDRRIHYASTRKRGINTLINIMAKFGSDHEMESEITHNERLEFLGDAVVEFVTSIHLFHLFPDLEEGGLATYRAAIVQNQHLAVLANNLNLDQYMLYAHGSDLCHDSELRHAMANCFEALMGALFLDGGIEEVADRVFGKTLYGNEPELHHLWTNYSRHPLQTQEPNGDRHWIESHTVLQNLTQFEDSIGVEFTHIRLLARAFTDRSLGFNNLSRGSNQRLEFLGDTVLQLISSEYLYRHFPDHHEGHLSLLRSSLVNNRTQALVCDDLGMTQYAMRGDPKSEMKTKDRADLLEAFLGALYIDKGLEHCTTFCSVCFFPRLNKSIIKQEWNDPKSKLQQCCLTLRAMDGREPDIPVYKVTQSLGPTNTRVYIVAVYFRSRRLATAKGHSIQEAEMNAAAEALKKSGHLFPQLNHQRSVMDKTSKKLRHR